MDQREKDALDRHITEDKLVWTRDPETGSYSTADGVFRIDRKTAHRFVLLRAAYIKGGKYNEYGKIQLASGRLTDCKARAEAEWVTLQEEPAVDRVEQYAEAMRRGEWAMPEAPQADQPEPEYQPEDVRTYPVEQPDTAGYVALVQCTEPVNCTENADCTYPECCEGGDPIHSPFSKPSAGYCDLCRAKELELYGDILSTTDERHVRAVREAGCKHPAVYDWA